MMKIEPIEVHANPNDEAFPMTNHQDQSKKAPEHKH
jgi:hypothetical protein